MKRLALVLALNALVAPATQAIEFTQVLADQSLSLIHISEPTRPY